MVVMRLLGCSTSVVSPRICSSQQRSPAAAVHMTQSSGGQAHAQRVLSIALAALLSVSPLPLTHVPNMAAFADEPLEMRLSAEQSTFMLAAETKYQAIPATPVTAPKPLSLKNAPAPPPLATKPLPPKKAPAPAAKPGGAAAVKVESPTAEPTKAAPKVAAKSAAKLDAAAAAKSAPKAAPSAPAAAAKSAPKVAPSPPPSTPLQLAAKKKADAVKAEQQAKVALTKAKSAASKKDASSAEAAALRKAEQAAKTASEQVAAAGKQVDGLRTNVAKVRCAEMAAYGWVGLQRTHPTSSQAQCQPTSSHST
jgi:hypothetical protein